MDVFVYGTLTEYATVTAILDEYEFRGPAELIGLKRREGRYPTLAPGGVTEGRILRTPERDTLDQYEGVDRGLYVRVTLPYESSDATDSVACYVGDPAALQVSVDWPGEGSFETRVREYCRAQDVVVRST